MEIDFTIYQPKERVRIATAIAKAIETSFVKHVCRQTADEVRRRYNLCARLFYEMCYESRWSLGRFEASVSAALDRELNGQKFSGSKTVGSWCTNPRTELVPKDNYEMTEQGILVPRDV